MADPGSDRTAGRLPTRRSRPGGPAGGCRSSCSLGWSPAAPPATSLIEGWSRGTPLHDGHLGHDRRLSRSASAVAGGRVFTMVVLTVGVATVLYTFSFFMARLVEGDFSTRWSRRRRERMLDELDSISSSAASAAWAASSPASSRARSAVRRHRARSGAHAGGCRRRLSRRRGGREQRKVLTRVGIKQARGFIAAVSTDAENVYAVLTARLDAAGSLHHRPRRDRRCANASWCGPAPIG